MVDATAESIKSLEGYQHRLGRRGSDALSPQPCAPPSDYPRRQLGDLVFMEPETQVRCRRSIPAGSQTRQRHRGESQLAR
jgi:hypothetical protein